MGNSSVKQEEQQRIDATLNELDRVAHIETTPSIFYRELLRQAKYLLSAKDVGVVVRLQAGRWGLLSSTSAKFGEQAEQQLQVQMTKRSDELPRFLSDKTATGHWLGSAFPGGGWASGGIVAVLSDTTQPMVFNEAEQQKKLSQLEMLSAISEIADGYRTRQKMFRWEAQSDEIRSVIRSLVACGNHEEANQNLVDGARCLIDADRVTLLESRGVLGKTETIAISGLPYVDSRSSLVIAMNKLVMSESLNTPSSGELEKLTRELESVVAITVPVVGINDAAVNVKINGSTHCLIFEWFDRERYVSSAEQMNQVLPWLTDAWRAHSLPRRHPVRVPRLFKYAIAVASIVGFIILLATPAEMIILAQGTMQPSEQRFVFSPAEGYVDKIHVADGRKVLKGEIVAVIISPQLQLQLSRVSAEIGLVDQKRDSLNLTLNQLKPSDDQSHLMGSRLAGEVMELEAKRVNLLEQKQLLEREHERLQLRSPIDGTVVAWEVEKYLENRPVRRGDTLFRIAALADAWRLESAVVDWESGYVIDAYRSRKEKNEQLSVEYTLASSPGERKSGKVLSISDAMIDVAGSQNLEVIVLPDALNQNLRLGTSITISIPCGQFPRWFVWTRSIVDAVRRRFWI